MRTRGAVAVQDPLARGHDPGLDLDLAADPAPAQGVAAVLVVVAVADAVAVLNQGHILNPSQSQNPNRPNIAAHDLNPNQETAQSRNLSQSPNPDLVLGPRLRGQSPGRSPNPKPSLPRKIDLVAKDRGATDRDPDPAASIAKAAAVRGHR